MRAKGENRRELVEGPHLGQHRLVSLELLSDLIKEHGETAVEDATWKASRVTREQ
jgi:hypothetical protein